MTMKPLRIAVICDFLEEEWPSMDLVAEMLLESLKLHHRNDILAIPIRPGFVRRLGRFPRLSGRAGAFNIDRALNRFVDYPKFIRRIRNDFDIFHIVDHSYSHL